MTAAPAHARQPLGAEEATPAPPPRPGPRRDTRPDAEVRLRLTTPEGIAFSLLLAGPGIRFVALLVDVLIVYGGLGLLNMLLSALAIVAGGLSGVALILAGFLAPIAYAMALEWRLRGQTIGKRLLRLRVMDRRGLPLAGWQVILRNLMRVLDSLAPFYTVGGLACALTRHYQRLGDLLAGTVVVREAQTARPNLAALGTEKFNSFLAYPQCALRLRLLARPPEAYLALAALLRRDALLPAARARLYAALADYFQRRAPFPPELRETLSDEHYLRNVVDVLFSGQRRL